MEWFIPGSTTHWIALSDVKLLLNLLVKTGSGTKLPTSSFTAVGNNVIHTLFDLNVDLKINNIAITSGSNLNAYTSFMHKHLFHDRSTIKKRSHLEGPYITLQRQGVRDRFNERSVQIS